MDFEKLISLIDAGEQDKAKEYVNTIKTQFSNNLTELQAYESKFNEAKDGRDKTKAKLKEIVDALGIDPESATADAVKELLKKGKSDDTSKAEIDNLAKMLKAKDDELISVKTNYESQLRDKIIENEIAKISLDSDVVNDRALKLVIDSLKDGALIEDGHIVYRNKESNTIMRDSSGNPLSIAAKMNEFKSDPNNAFLFKATTQQGGGTQQSSSGGVKKMQRERFEQLPASEQMGFIKDGGEVIQ